ncbi:hypothetical protein FBU30_003609 [Linnemannia zychae]|nr:hypothetical protein FBU30_003609 [Linnemannia zychae]
MATSHHHRQDDYVQDSEDCTSDSNEEFASASEGDDDLPWEPVVIRSPIISKQSPVSPISSAQVEIARPIQATSIATSTIDSAIIKDSHSSSSLVSSTTTTSSTTRTLTATTSSFSQQQWQEQHQSYGHDLNQEHQEYYQHQYNTLSYEQGQERGQHYSQQQQWSASSMQSSSTSPRTQHAHHEFSSSTTSMSQSGSSQTLRGTTPKLRERMRQSPILHSRIVQVYLDPNASSAQRQQQHIASETVRQAWLQDRQESSEDDTEEEQDQRQQYKAPSRPRSTYASVPVYQHPILPPPEPGAVMQSSESSISADQQSTHQSWNEAEHKDMSQQDHHQEEEAWGFDGDVDIEDIVQSSEQQASDAWGFDDHIDTEGVQHSEQHVVEAWGFEDHVDMQGGAQSVESSVEVAGGFSDNVVIEDEMYSEKQQAAPTLGIDDNTSMEEKVQDQPPEDSFHNSNGASGREIAQTTNHNLRMEETIQSNLQTAEEAWDFDDNIDIENAPPAEEHITDATATADATIQIEESNSLDDQPDESAWGFDENIHVDEVIQPEHHQTESNWSFNDTIEINTTAPSEQYHEDSSIDIGIRNNSDKSDAESGQHFTGASWGFEDKVEVADTPQVEQIESSWGFDESLVVEEVSSVQEPELTNNDAIPAESSFPTMHRAHESEADAWDYDDQVIELVEEAAAQEIHSRSLNTEALGTSVHQSVQQHRINTTNESFTDHDTMPPSSTTPSTNDNDSEQEISDAADHHVRASQSLHDEQHSSVDHISSRAIHSSNSTGPSRIAEDIDAEQSWGFDMDEVIGSQNIELADLDNTLEESSQSGVQERTLSEEYYAESTTVHRSRDDADQTPSVIEEDGTVDIIETAAVKETNRVNLTSEDEFDTEVRKVLFATQTIPVDLLTEDQSSEISPFATSHRAFSGHSVAFEDRKPYYADSAVTSNLLVKEEPSLLQGSDSTGTVSELKRSGSDSEGSDIYCDLSTAYTGRNMSSNRLNEILDDDDYLEHMERGVPMDRPISTPVSDDESQKFVMEDDIVEQMERGEPQYIGGSSSNRLDTPDRQDISMYNRTSCHEPVHAVDVSDIAISSNSAPATEDKTTRNLTDTVVDTTVDLISHPIESITIGEESSNFSAEVSKVSTPEPERPSNTEKTVEAISDDHDSCNPFSDVAAIDEVGLSSAVENSLEKAEKTAPLTVQTPSQSPMIDIMDQSLGAVAEPMAESATSSITTPQAVHMHIDEPETQSVAENFDQDIIDGLDGDAWGDQDLESLDHPSTPIHTVEVSVKPNIHLQDPFDVESNNEQSELSAEPDYSKTEGSNIVTLDHVAVEETTTEANEVNTLPSVEPVAIHVKQDAPLQQSDIAITSPVDKIRNQGANNQTEVLDLDAALEEDAWAIQEDTISTDVHVAPMVDVALNRERSLSSLFADKSEKQYMKPASPIRGFAAFAPTSPQEHSVSDLFREKSEQPDAKPVSPIRGFSAFTSASRDSQEQSHTKPASRARGFAAFANISHDTQEEHHSKPTRSRGFAAFANTSRDTQEQSHISSRIRGFAAFANTTNTSAAHSVQEVTSKLGSPGHRYGIISAVEQEKSVSDLFPDTPIQQPTNPTASISAPVPAPISVCEMPLEDAIEEDAWNDQNLEFDDNYTSLASKSEPEPEVKPEPEVESEAERTPEQARVLEPEKESKPELEQAQVPEPGQVQVPEPEQVQVPEPVLELEQIHEPDTVMEQESTTAILDIEQSIKDALEGDAWGDDQDIQIDQETEPFQEEHQPDVLVVSTNGHEIPEQTKTSQIQNVESVSTAHSFGISQSIDAALEENAWGSQDDIIFESTLPSQQEQVLEPQDETSHKVSELSAIETHVPAHNHEYQEALAEPSDIEQSFVETLKEDPWSNQDERSSELSCHPVEDAQVSHSSEDITSHTIPAAEVDLDHAIDAALEEDMWADNDILTIDEAPGLPQSHVDANVPLNEEIKSTRDSPVLEHAKESTVLPTPLDARSEFDIIKSIIDDNKGDQAINVDLRPVEQASFNQDTNISSAQEAPNIDMKEFKEIDNKDEAIVHQTITKTAAEIVEDAWGWDEDDIDISLETQKDNSSSQFNEATVTQNDKNENEHSHIRVSLDQKERPSEEKSSSDMHSPIHAITETPNNPLSPLEIQKERIAPGADSGEGDADSATQSPWQDISPASVSKRSEAGMSIGSEFESEYSIQSLDDDGHISSTLDHHTSQTQETSTRADSEVKQKIDTTWTDLKDDDAWNEDLPDMDLVSPSFELKESFVTKEEDNSVDAPQLPDISGADSWDFDQDDGQQSESSLSFAGLTPASTRSSFTRTIKTPDMTERHSLGSLNSPQNKTPTFSSMTSSPGQILSSYQSSIAGSTPASPSRTTTTVMKSHTEVEDDSHLPAAIRQQRARLAARGKPLPPISKYTSTKETNEEQQSTKVASPRIAAASPSPVISFALPDKGPSSPLLNPAPAVDQKYLSPALQKQRERLEKKKAASAATAASSLSTSRRLTLSESSSQAPIKPISPQLKESVLPSALKHSLTSPTIAKKSAQLMDRTEATVTSPSTFSNEEFNNQYTRRRGLSVSSNQSAQASSPSTPTVEGMVRRSKEIHHYSMFSTSNSATTTPTNATFFETGETNVVRSTQNDAFRHSSRLSMSSSTGSGWDGTIEEDVQVEEVEGPKGWRFGKKDNKKDSNILGKGTARKESEPRPAFLSTTSSSFFQQSVPGLDDEESNNSGIKSTPFTGSNITTTVTSTTTTSTTSSYLGSKKVDDYDPYGPMASRKAKSSFDQDRDSYPESNEVLIGRSNTSHGASFMSPTSATSISHRHDYHSQQQSSSSNKLAPKETTITHTSSGGSFFRGGGSLVGDINDLLQEKKNSVSMSSHALGSDYEPKKPSPAGPPSAVQQKQQQLPKSTSWSFGSWVSSAVAAATEKIDQAYESLDPEYSRMKARSPMMSNSTSTASIGAGLEGAGIGGDPDSLSPFKKPGYVVGGSSLALGLASISTTASAPSTKGSSGMGNSGGATISQGRESHYGRSSFSETSTPTLSSKRDEDNETSFAMAGGTESDTYGHHHAHHRGLHHHHNHSTDRDQSMSPRLTRKNVSGR